jgi:hypothetical protein
MIMARYLIESPHTEAECLDALDQILAQGDASLAKWDWGCMVDDHRGWAIVEADSEAAARKTLPNILRKKARIVEVDKFTRKDLEGIHKRMAAGKK